VQGGDKTCAGAFLCQNTSHPHTQGKTSSRCTGKREQTLTLSAEQAQKCDLELSKLINLWPSLPKKIRASILTIAKITIREAKK